MNKKIELIMPVFFAGVGATVIVAGARMPRDAGEFSFIVGSLMIISAVMVFYAAIKNPSPDINFSDMKLNKVIETALVVVAYAITLKYLGYVVPSFILSTYIMQSLGYRNLKKAIIVGAVSTILIFVLFKILLKVPLPQTIFKL